MKAVIFVCVGYPMVLVAYAMAGLGSILYFLIQRLTDAVDTMESWALRLNRWSQQ